MRCQKSLVCFLLILGLVWLAWGGQTREAVLFEELMNQTTNSWCVNSEVFSAAVNTNMLELSRIGTPSAKAYGRRWLLALADLPVSTNSHHVYCMWITKKTRCLFGAGRRYLDVDSTNLWLSVATELGRIKSSQTTESAIEAKYMTVQEESPGSILVSGFPQGYYDEVEKLGAERESASRLQSLIIDWIGKRGLPRLPSEDRLSICCELELRAGLTASETMRLRQNAQLLGKDNGDFVMPSLMLRE